VPYGLVLFIDTLWRFPYINALKVKNPVLLQPPQCLLRRSDFSCEGRELCYGGRASGAIWLFHVKRFWNSPDPCQGPCFPKKWAFSS
jgi:hypothetical protein